MDFVVNVNDKQYNRVKHLNKELGMILWNIAVLNAPYDTGNLRRAISLASNNSNNIRIQYSLLNANYIKFLEYGYGPVKKHIGFIRSKTLSDMVEAIIGFIKVDNVYGGLLSLPPLVVLQRAKTFFWQENRVAQRLDFANKKMTANQRQKISRIREREWKASQGRKIQLSAGQKVETTTRSKLSKAFSGRNIIGGL